MAGEAREDRAQRILESAIHLAEQGGFDAVRMRDIASHAKVAVGTVYNRFSSKEDILVAVLEYEVSILEDIMERYPARGSTHMERISAFFQVVTAELIARPKLSRAALRATASGDPTLTEKVQRFHTRITRLVEGALQDDEGDASGSLGATERGQLAFYLSQLWFAALVGWMGGMYEESQVVEQVESAAYWLLRGMGVMNAPAPVALPVN